MKIITKNAPDPASINMLTLERGTYTGLIQPASLPGIVIVLQSGGEKKIIYREEDSEIWKDAREPNNSFKIKFPVRVKIETITAIAV